MPGSFRDRELARQLTSRQKRIRVENPDCELWQVVQPNNNGTLRLTRPHWPVGSYIDNVQVRGGGKAASFRPGTGAYVEFENGDRNSPYVVAFGGWIPAKQPVVPGTGQWVQAESGPGLNARPMDGMALIDWQTNAWDTVFTSPVSGDVLANPSYTGRGHVYWQDAAGIGWMAWSFWTDRPDGVWLAVGVDRQIPAEGEFAQVYYLAKYDIANHGGALSLGGDSYGGGIDHGSLSLHYTPSSNTLTAFGPLTHPDGRMHCYRIRLGVTLNPVVKTVLTKPAVHASVGGDSLLIANWDDADGTVWSHDLELYKLNPAGTAYVLNKRILLSEILEADTLVGCNPNNYRAKGRPAYDPGTNCFYVWLVERQASNKDLGSTEGYFVVPERVDCVFFGDNDWACCTMESQPPHVYDQVNYDFFSDSNASLLAINATTGAVSKVVEDFVNAISDTVTNTDSQDWYAANVPLEDTGSYPVDVINDRGWAVEGEVADGSGLYRHLLIETPEPVLVFPLQARNEETVAPDVFNWSPPQVLGTNQGPGGVTVGTGSKKIVIRAIPEPELYGSATAVSSGPYQSGGEDITSVNAADCCKIAALHALADCMDANPWINDVDHIAEYEAWIYECNAANIAANAACDELISEVNYTIMDAWRNTQRRCGYRTWLGVLGATDAVDLHVDISRSFTGLKDSYGMLFRDWEARPILDQVWAGHYCKGTPEFQARFEQILLLRDGRTQESTYVSAARPVIEVLDTDGVLVDTIKCTPDEAIEHHVREPIMSHGLNQDGAWFCDVFTHWQGADDAYHMRITSILWGDAPASYTTSTKDFTWGDGTLDDLPTDADLDGLAYVGERVLMQHRQDLFRYP